VVNPPQCSNRQTPMKITAMQSSNSVRASISFPSNIYEALETLAKQKKVSLAWVVREASEKYIAEQKPAVRKQKKR